MRGVRSTCKHNFQEHRWIYRAFHSVLRDDKKIYYRKTVGHVFTKPVQIEGTTQNFFPSELFFIVFHISAARRCECM